MAEVTLKEFLNNDSTVKAARKKLTGANAEVAKLKSALAASASRISEAQKAELQGRIDLAQAAADEAQKQVKDIEATRTSYFNINQKSIQEKATGQEVSKAKQELQEVLALKQQYPSQSAALDVRIADLNDRINRTGKYSPAAPKITIDESTLDQSKKTTPRDYNTEIKNAAQLIRNMKPNERLDLSQVLKNANYKVTPTSIYTDQLVAAYQTALVDNQARTKTWQEEVPWSQFITDKIAEAKATAGGGLGGPGAYSGPMSYPTITSPEDAKSSIIKKFKELLNREPTNAEIKEATKALNTDESKPENAPVNTPIKNKAGQITGYKKTGGTNTDQFLTDYLTSKFSSEVETIKTQAPSIAQLAKDKKIYDDAIAAANGDKTKIDAAKQNTTYGRNLSEYEAQITKTAKSSGATNDPKSISAIAKYILDKGLAINSDSADNYINSQLTFGKNKVATGTTGAGTPADMYTGTAGSNVNALNKVALANGLNLNQVFDPAALNGVLAAVQSGESIDTYAKIIRDAAKIAWNVSDNVAKLMDQGVSLETIYQPYKNLYSTTLELDPNSITLNDLAKVGVIGKQSEGSQAPQNLYDFQSALRKDNRWQYTRQAREEVSGAVQKVLKDFGFMG